MKKTTTKLYNFNKEMFERFKNVHLENKPSNVNTQEEQALEILKCKYNILYYLKHYCKIPLTGGSFTDLLMNDKLMTVALLYQAGAPFIFQTARQSSKTTIILCCTSWYISFYENTKVLFYNMKIPDNKKNLSIVKQIISNLPAWMRTYDPKVHPNNVESFKNGLNSEIFLKTVDRVDPGASGRGLTGIPYFDEFGFIHNIHLAYSAIMFTYSNYSRIARKNYVPAPLAITSTPADPITPEGELFQKKWEEGVEVTFSEIKDLLPHEIYEFCDNLAQGNMCKVYQNWFEYPDRCDPKLYDEENPDNIRHLLLDPFVDIEELKSHSLEAAKYISEVRSYVTSKTKLRQEVFCEFISSADQTIFEEDFIESIPRHEPLSRLKMPNTVSGTLDIYSEYTDTKVRNDNYAICVDPAYRIKGDYAGIVIYNLETNEIEATAKLKLGKINNLVEVVKFIHSMYPKSVIIVERNNFGIAVIERLLEEPRLNKQIFFTYGKKDPRKLSTEQKNNSRVYGIQTDSSSRPKMIQMLIKYVLTNPEKLKSRDLINELNYLQEKKGGRIEAVGGQHDDLVMALSFILYLLEYKEKELNQFKTLSVSGLTQLNKIVDLNRKELVLSHTDRVIREYSKYADKTEYADGVFDLSAFKVNDNDGRNMLRFITNLNKMPK